MRRRGGRRGHYTGFTLVEMLVVMAIIAILIAVSFAGFRSALIHARRAKCASNLRAIGVGMLAFAADNNQNLPESGGTIPHGEVDPSVPGSGMRSWTEQLEPYLGVSSATMANPIYQCPDYVSKSVAGDAQYSYFNGAHAAYSASHGTFAAVGLLKIRSLSTYIMAGDCAYNGFQAQDADKDDYTQDPAFSGSMSKAVVIPIHGGYSNILFGDGHVEGLQYFDPTTYTTVYNPPNTSYLVP